jgi:hypothetical protein
LRRDGSIDKRELSWARWSPGGESIRASTALC